MRVRLLVPIHVEGTLRPTDSELELDKDTALRWIRDGQAVPLTEEPEAAVVQAPERAVLPKPKKR